MHKSSKAKLQELTANNFIVTRTYNLVTLLLFVLDELTMGGCRGDPSLCDSDAAVVCSKDNSVVYDCECVYVDDMEDLPPCEEVTSTRSNPPSTESNSNPFKSMCIIYYN